MLFVVNVWPWILVPTLLVGLACALAAWVLDDGIGSDAAILPGIGAIIAAIGALVFACVAIGKHYDRIHCDQFGQQANRQTKFVTYSTFGWDCLTPTKGGRWIPTDNLREFGDAR